MTGVRHIDDFKIRVAEFLASRPDIRRTDFGFRAIGDRDFVRKLERGRDYRLSTITRVLDYIDQLKKGVEA